MGKKYASIKRRPKEEAKPSPRTIAHNQRYSQSEDLLPIEHRLENYHLVKVSNATKTFHNWKVENEERYDKVRGRKLRSNAHRLESLVIILSGEQVAKCNPDAIWENALKFKEWFETRYKTKVRTMDWHRDEGHVNDDGEVERNDHVHLEFDNVNEDGKMVRRLFSNGDVIGFQDKIAEIYKPLGFIRGEDTAKRNRSDEPKIGLGQKAWKKKRTKETLATTADVKKLNKALYAELQEAKALSSEYRAIDEEMRKLKADAKAKVLTIQELEKIAYRMSTKKVKVRNKILTKQVKTSYKEILENQETKEIPDMQDFLEEVSAMDIQGNKELVEKIKQAKKTVIEIRASGKAKREAIASAQEQIVLVHTEPAKRVIKEVEIEKVVEVIKEVEIEKIVIKEDTTRIEVLESTIAIQEDSLIAKDVEIASLKLELLNALSKLMKFSCKFIDRIKTGLSKVHDTHEIVIDDDAILSTMNDDIVTDTNSNPGM